MGSRLMEKDLRDLTSHTHSEKKKSEPLTLNACYLNIYGFYCLKTVKTEASIY